MLPSACTGSKPSIWKKNCSNMMSTETRRLLLSTLRSNSIFVGFSDAQFTEILRSLRPRNFGPGYQIIQKGAMGNTLFLVESGECFSAEINTSFRPGTIFGELALMYNSPRSCDIFCKRAARLWTLNRDDYRRIVAAGTKKQPTLRWEALQRAFYSHAGADGKLSVYELRSMLLEVFGIQLDHSDSTGTSLIEAMLDALDRDQSGDVDIDELHAAWRTWFGGSITPKRCLVIIDVQNDFIDGNLALKHCPAGEDANAIVPVINRLRQQNLFDFVAVSLDWHPQTHCSFWECAQKGDFPAPLHPTQGLEAAMTAPIFTPITLLAPDGHTAMKQTLWPRHCVQNTWGAACHVDLHLAPDDIIVYKGTDPCIDSYSCVFDNGKYKQTGLLDELRSKEVTHVYLCGLAEDVCVAFSALHMAEAGFVTTVIEDGCASVDHGQRSSKRALMMDAGVQLVNSNELPDLISSASLREALHAASRIRHVKKQVLSVAQESGHAPIAS